MNKILIAEDSPVHLKLLINALEPYKDSFQILTAANGEKATEILSNNTISTLITDLYMPKMDGLELLSYMSREHPKIPCIVVSGYDSPEIQDTLNKNWVYGYIKKPFDQEELVKTIFDAKVQYEEGDALEGLSISGFLQFIQMEEKSCILEVTGANRDKGVFYFVNGALYNAECKGLNAEKAAITMIGWDNVTLRLKSLPSTEIERRIGFNLTTLIFEGAKKKDEQKENSETAKNTGPVKVKSADMLYQAVRKAECNDEKSARQILTTLLKHNPRDGKAWLWFSRVANTMKSIVASLENASKIAPDDPEVAEENKKLQISLLAGCPDKGEVKHCPFCRAPIVDEFEACPYCKACLSLNTRLFSSTGKADSKILEKALHTYTKIVLVEKKAKACFHLGLAYANLGKWHEALDLLYKTIKLEPENDYYKQQLMRLLDHMTNLESSDVETENSEEEIYRPVENLSDETKKILVIDDSATTRKVVRVILTQEGFDVIEAKNGIEALARLNEVMPDLVLLDIIMPGMNGYEVLGALKKINSFKNIPIIMLTARDSLMDRLKGKMSASDEYLTKPFTSASLMEKINKYLV